MGDEMFERGLRDAEQNELNPFYYQHYYHYRRGYNLMRGRLRWRHPLFRFAVVALALALVLLLVALLNWLPQSMQQASLPAVLPTVKLLPSPTATSLPTPTRTPRPTVTPRPQLLVGARALVVNTEGSPLRGRSAPGLAAPVRVRFEEGAQLELLEGPVEVDGLTWWRVRGEAGEGWCAQTTAQGVVLLRVLE